MIFNPGNLVFFIIALLLAFLVWWKRDNRMIKSKGYGSMMATITFIALLELQYAFLFECWSSLIILYFGVLCLANVFTTRAFVLLFRYKIQDEVAALHNGGQVGWYLRHRHWINHRSLAAVVLTKFGVALVAFIIYLGASEHWQCEEARVVQRTYRNVVLVMHIVLALGLAWLMKSFRRDVLGLKMELALIAVVTLLTLILYQAVSMGLTDPVIRNQATDIINNVCFGVIMMISCVWPVIQACSSSPFLPSKSCGGGADLNQLKHLLHTDVKFRDSFFRFLQMEFSTENLIFYEEISHFRRYILKQNTVLTSLPSPEVKKQVNEITDKFIGDDSPMVVNISSTTRANILRDVREWRLSSLQAVLTVFDKAEAEVYNLMNKDSYTRFSEREKRRLQSSRGSRSSHASSAAAGLETGERARHLSSSFRPLRSGADSRQSGGSPIISLGGARSPSRALTHGHAPTSESSFEGGVAVMDIERDRESAPMMMMKVVEVEVEVEAEVKDSHAEIKVKIGHNGDSRGSVGPRDGDRGSGVGSGSDGSGDGSSNSGASSSGNSGSVGSIDNAESVQSAGSSGGGHAPAMVVSSANHAL